MDPVLVPVLDAAGLFEPESSRAVRADTARWFESELADAQASYEARIHPHRFVEFVAARFDRLPVAIEHQAEFFLGDLALAFLLLAHDPSAIRWGRAALDPVIARVVRRHLPDHLEVHEVVELVWEKLLVASGDQLPRLQGYAGTGSLQGWMMVVATRIAIDAGRRDARARPVDLATKIGQAAESGTDPEVEYLKRHYEGEFVIALRAALTELEPRSRAVLSYAFVDGLNQDQIARAYAVHRTTANRWLADARRELLRRTRAELLDRLRVGTQELDSILRLIESRMEITFSGLL